MPSKMILHRNLSSWGLILFEYSNGVIVLYFEYWEDYAFNSFGFAESVLPAPNVDDVSYSWAMFHIFNCDNASWTHIILNAILLFLQITLSF